MRGAGHVVRIPITVTALLGALLPDLLVTALSAPSVVKMGDAVSVSVTVKNQGPGPAYTYYSGVTLLISRDPVASTDDSFVSGCGISDNTGSLQPLEEKSCIGPVTFKPAPALLPETTTWSRWWIRIPWFQRATSGTTDGTCDPDHHHDESGTAPGPRRIRRHCIHRRAVPGSDDGVDDDLQFGPRAKGTDHHRDIPLGRFDILLRRHLLSECDVGGLDAQGTHVCTNTVPLPSEATPGQYYVIA